MYFKKLLYLFSVLQFLFIFSLILFQQRVLILTHQGKYIAGGNKFISNLSQHKQTFNRFLTLHPNHPKKFTLTIIYTNNANGIIQSCDCPSNPYGGLLRRVNVIKNLSKDYPEMLKIDTGDFFPSKDDKLLAKYCIKIMKLCNYDVVGIGDQELICGVEFLKQHLFELPFLCGNLKICLDKVCIPISQSYIIKDINNLKVGVVSIVDKKGFNLFPKSEVKKIEVIDHKEFLKTVINEIRPICDFIVVVSHCGAQEDKIIAQEVPGIDVIIGGHSQTLFRSPLKVKNTLVLQAGENGHYVGKITFIFNQQKKLYSYKHQLILLNKDISADKDAESIFEDYKNELKKLAPVAK
ncbi:MAG: hypothetical protein N2Z73_03940 [Endomicrobia bacterium]|nr:hypothetical protein [Endomicrobiia bacterium]